MPIRVKVVKIPYACLEFLSHPFPGDPEYVPVEEIQRDKKPIEIISLNRVITGDSNPNINKQAERSQLQLF